MTMTRRLGLLVVVALSAPGCSTLFDFDESPTADGEPGGPDAGIDPDERDGPGPPLPDADLTPYDAVFRMPDAFVSDAAVVRETTRLAIIRDTYVREKDPTFNYGAQATFCADMPTDARTALVQPDLAAVPDGAIAESVELHLWTGANTNDYSLEVYTLYEIQETWNEGAQDAAAGTSSWNNRQGGVAWTRAGCGAGSRSTVAVGSFAPLLVNTEYVVAVDPALMNRWLLDRTTNHGLAIVASGIDGACFTSTEGLPADHVPWMSVTWRLPPARL